MLLAACGGTEPASLSGPAGTRSGEPPTLAGPATTTTAPPAVLPSVLPPPTARTGTATSTTAVAAAPTTTAAPGRAAALTPAPAGTYRYNTMGSSRVGGLVTAFPAVTTLVVDPPSGTTQHSTRNLKDAAGSGPVFESTFDYRPDGVYLVSLKLTATVLVVTQSSDLRPPSPVLFLPNDAAPGYHREIDIPAQSGQGTAHLVLDVRRTERVTIGGRAVDTLVVQLVTSLAGQIGGQVDITVWLAPANRLWVKERFVADAASPDGALQYHSEYDATLQALP